MTRSGGRAIALARERRGWSQNRLAAEWGVQKARVNRLERGKSKLNLATIESLLPVLGIGTEQYFTLLVLFEQAAEELSRYPVGEQGRLPFRVGEAAAAAPPALGGWDDPEVAAAQERASAACRDLQRLIDAMDVRRALREERAKARPETAPPTRPRRRRSR
ncbi:MAG TPA: helix-turn-helix transcriptional regulator [Thermoanaerobaculia bacterium]|nr:helix-turn-helix transcriptional regulator [Thermoanaerobaculia bacterium]